MSLDPNIIKQNLRELKTLKEPERVVKQREIISEEQL